MPRSDRKFTSVPAVRERVPLWVGLIGPSGTGKTYSALRLATGMSKVYGDGVFFIDTEARRSSHYADQFRFSVVDFKPPFGPLDYLAAVEHCISQGARTIVIDSMSHEWEGEGGVLEQHDIETQRLAEKWRTSPEKAQMSGWAAPKADHRRLMSTMIQSGLNFVICYRAKEKLKIVRNQDPKPLGWQPIGPDDLVYEATVNMLLTPGAKGVPSWSPVEEGEKALVKMPRQFEALFKEGRPLDEATGEALARWAAGGAAQTTPPPAATGGGSPTAASKSPAPGAATPATASSSPKATEGTLRALSEQLTANGERTPAAQLLWVRKTTGKAIEALTESEAQQLLERACGEAAA
jgi:hypothetical protein